MERYFITHCELRYPYCHDNAPKKCKDFKRGGCAWISREEMEAKKYLFWCKHSLIKYAAGRPECCPHNAICNKHFIFCRNGSCEKVVKEPLYRFYVGMFDDEERELFLTKIATDRKDFLLNSESELTKTQEDKDKHAELLDKFADDTVYSVFWDWNEDVKFINNCLYHGEEIMKSRPSKLRGIDFPTIMASCQFTWFLQKTAKESDIVDCYTYRLSLEEDLTWSWIAKLVNERFCKSKGITELDADLAEKKAKGYWKKYKDKGLMPIPKRNPGPKSKSFEETLAELNLDF